jgi:preprotein translocase subunit SecY
LRVNQAGVMPIIFASSLLLFPAVFFDWLGRALHSQWLQRMAQTFSSSTAFVHNVLYIVLIYFFLLFLDLPSHSIPKTWPTISRVGVRSCPGYRLVAGPPITWKKVMARITYVGAAFLAVVAIAPTIVSASATIDPTLASFYGGTSLLIAVSVAVDLVQKIDSHLVMRNYKGLTE